MNLITKFRTYMIIGKYAYLIEYGLLAAVTLALFSIGINI